MNSDRVNLTGYYDERYTVKCDEDHFALGIPDIPIYETVCNVDLMFDPVMPCYSE